ncbi:MAG: flagellar FlbD family protein [Myxococcaceae bacterium]|nr:flagellar FlbD family protein [Myxococcaceae bacterium]
MIRVTKLDGKETVVNTDLVLIVEDTPDTVLTFTNGVRMVVKEPVEEIINRTVQFRRRLATGLQVVPGNRER